jgi:hypothetical protein
VSHREETVVIFISSKVTLQALMLRLSPTAERQASLQVCATKGGSFELRTTLPGEGEILPASPSPGGE